MVNGFCGCACEFPASLLLAAPDLGKSWSSMELLSRYMLTASSNDLDSPSAA